MTTEVISSIIKILTSEEVVEFCQKRIQDLKTKKRFAPKKSFDYIREIYTKTPDYDLLNDFDLPDTSVEIEGTLSTFSPVFPGPASIKQSLHLDFRRNTEKIREELKKSNRSLSKTTFDSLLSCSSGQMIMRNIDMNSRIIPLGFFQSIVRNCIPVFIDYKYFEKEIKKLFIKSSSPNFFEAKITGHVIPYYNKLIAELFKIKPIAANLDLRKYESLKKTKALLIDGEKYKIHFIGNPRYLDGDIWIALKKGNIEALVTRFLELTNEEEFSRERNELRNDCLIHFPESKILKQFDNMVKVFECDRIPC